MTVDATPYMDICEKLSAEVEHLRFANGTHLEAIEILERVNGELRARIGEFEAQFDRECDAYAERVRELETGLEDLRKSAALLYQNTLGYAPAVHGGTPRWLIDCKASIDRAATLTQKSGETDGL